MSTKEPMLTRFELEDRVTCLLNKHGVDSAPIPIEMIALGEGLRIVEMEFGGDISGALMRNKSSAGIAVNAAQHLNRRRFTIAHELAHFKLEHMGEDHMDWQFTVLRRDGKSSEATDYKEIEANFFAASLLMPKTMLRADVERKRRFTGDIGLSDDDVRLLAKKYVVSETAMRYRLMNLGFMSIT